MPLCRRGILAGGSSGTLIVDGHINPGMSGGPVVTETGVAGVISGWFIQEVSDQGNTTQAIEINNPLGIGENAGLFAAVSFDVAIGLIESAGAHDTGDGAPRL